MQEVPPATTAALRRLLFGPSPLGQAAIKLQRYRVSATEYVIPGRPYCDEPVQINRQEAKPAEGYAGLSLQMWGPCRRCAKCLLFRGLKWRDRMRREMALTPGRTWFLTLTFAPIHLAGVLIEANRFPHLSRDEAVERAAYTNHVAKYLKRLRKAGARFRFVGVPEYGEEHGRLHYHLLMHEQLEGSLTKRLMDAQWRSFTKPKLVMQDDDGEVSAAGAARYVSKYLTKSLGRPRASLRYGAGPSPTDPS